MISGCALIIFAKAPVAGFAKTRLASALGDEGAARLAGRMLNETLKTAIAADIGPIELCCAPNDDHPAFRQAAAEHRIRLTTQGDGDLGARMHRALSRSLIAHRHALLIGTDALGLTPHYLRQAAQLLCSHRTVFGPAADGGYVLVGLSEPIPPLFGDIEWSTRHVMAQTRERLRRLGVDSAEIPTLTDVDEPNDLLHVPKEWLE
ncbi:MAG: TIGR04282 family arsenosugar biosynthesis glycosyltransferase [Burkholderiales bacterium]|nr:TIGR04282 family arsenosugar biosynthesis glycosyltransferase [Burkholderiales bacterium]